MIKKVIIGLFALILGILIVFLSTNPSKKDFEEFVPSIKSDLEKSGYEYVQLGNIARTKNHFIYSVWEVDFECQKYEMMPGNYYDWKVSTQQFQYYGILNNFHLMKN